MNDLEYTCMFCLTKFYELDETISHLLDKHMPTPSSAVHIVLGRSFQMDWMLENIAVNKRLPYDV